MQFKASDDLMPVRHRPLIQMLLVMNLTVILLVAGCLQVSASAYSQQTITLSEKHAPLETVLRDIRKQTGYTFFCKYEWLQQARKVDIEVKNASLDQVLELCFKDQPLKYTIVNKTIMVTPREVEKDKSLSPPVDIRGKITNEKGEPLVGATVEIKGSKKGTLTDANGIFELKQVNSDAVVVVSYTGYIPREIRVADGSFIAVSLALSANSLDETVVIAYGTTTKRLNTGDVGTVKAADIEKQPVSNPLLALQGRVPGIFIAQSTGLPGSGVTVRIQGQNSIGNGNDPLYVIDGVPYASQLLPLNNGILGNSGNGSFTGNPFNYINPADIESIDILKDADATAIYGSRASNGAILITTKKGRAGQTKIDVNYQEGMGLVTRKADLMNTKQYLQMRREAKRNDNAAISTTDYDINGFWDTTRSTDWQKTLIGGTARYTNANASVSGGNATTQYLVGGTYHRETTVFPGDFSDQKSSLHFNITNTSTNGKFHLQLSGSYLIDKNQLPGSDLTPYAINTPPDAPALYNPDGSLNWAPIPSGTSSISTFINPLSYEYNLYNNTTNNLIANAVLSYQILPGLEIRSNLGYTNLQSNEMSITPLISSQPEYRLQYGNSLRNAQYGNNNINSWIVEPQASYKRILGKGRLEVLAGTTILQNNSSRQQLNGTGYNSDGVLTDIKSAATVTVLSSIDAVYKYNAAFGRINYDWQDKYILDLTARRDGSSRFGSKNLFHNFGAVGGAWIFSKEGFMQKALPFISFGKLRASYGTTGNDQIGDYNFLNQYVSPTGVGVSYQGTTGLMPKGLSNPYLQWEETRKLQFGLDLGLLKDRILINANYFINRSSNQLLGYGLPIFTGFTTVAENFPATIQNSGWEFSLNTTNIKGKDFSWSSYFNLTLAQNKLVSFTNLATSSYASTYVIGQPITITRVYHFLGVDPATGVYQFADSHGRPTSTPSASMDKTVIINNSPTFYGGFENNFRYKGFELDVLFQFVKQKGLNYFFGNSPGIYDANQPVTVLDRWQKPGDVAPVQRYNSNFSLLTQSANMVSSDAGVSDASYIRLKNVSLSWQLPEKWEKKIHLQNCRIYALGQNLLTITKYPGMDPENKGALNSVLPPLRVMTLGLQIGL